MGLNTGTEQMALKDQPYMRLFVQDYLTDEKLNMCLPASQGVFAKIMCTMHKSEEYGVILLKQKEKQNSSTLTNFARKLAKLITFEVDVIYDALTDLVEEKVLYVDGDRLCQTRMIADNKLSKIRAESGSAGGKKTQKNFAKANSEANSEYDIDNEYDIIIINMVKEFYKHQETKHKNQLNDWENNKKLLYDSCSEIDKLNRLDKFTFKDIELVLKNVIEDKFWSKQIISLRGVRKKSTRNGQTKFQNAAVKCLKTDIWEDMAERAKIADSK